MRKLKLIFAGAMLLAGCNAPAVRREAEIGRFHDQMNQRLQELKLETLPPLSMSDCERLALENSLDLRVRELSLRLQDERVKMALDSGLPRASLRYDDYRRSNEALVKIDNFGAPGGASPPEFSFEDRHQQRLGVQAVVPVLDFGNTYYSFQIAKDRRSQERLLLDRSRQLLVRDVRIAYVQHAGAIRQQRLAKIALEAAQQVIRVARSLEKADMTVAADTSLVEAAVAQANLELSLSTQRVAETHLVLSQIMSLPPGTTFAIRDEEPQLPPPPDRQLVETYENNALETRPELHVQDLERHIAANDIRKKLSAFFPRLDLTGSYNWSNTSTAVNPAFFLYGFSVAHSLLDGGMDIFRYNLAKKTATMEEQRTMLLTLGVLYEVQFRALRVQQAHETIGATRALEKSRRAALDRIISLYKEGLEDEAGAARALADLTSQATLLERAVTDYLTAWHELDAAALPQVSRVAPTTQPATAPTTQPIAVTVESKASPS